MKNQCPSNILLLAHRYEKNSLFSITKNKKIVKSAAGVAAALIPIVIPIILNAIREEMMSVKTLREAVDQIIKESDNLQAMVDSPGWTSVKKFVGDVAGYTAFGGAVGGVIGGGIGGVAGLITGPGAAGTAAGGAAAGASIGAGIGAGYGAIKGISDIVQVQKVLDELPKHSEEIKKFKQNLKSLADVYDAILKQSEDKSSFSEERYGKITDLIGKFNGLIEEIQLQAGALSATVDNMRVAFSQVTDALSYVTIGVFSSIKDFQDAISKIYPEINKAVLTSKRLTERISGIEKSNGMPKSDLSAQPTEEKKEDAPASAQQLDAIAW